MGSWTRRSERHDTLLLQCIQQNGTVARSQLVDDELYAFSEVGSQLGQVIYILAIYLISSVSMWKILKKN